MANKVECQALYDCYKRMTGCKQHLDAQVQAAARLCGPGGNHLLDLKANAHASADAVSSKAKSLVGWLSAVQALWRPLRPQEKRAKLCSAALAATAVVETLPESLLSLLKAGSQEG